MNGEDAVDLEFARLNVKSSATVFGNGRGTEEVSHPLVDPNLRSGLGLDQIGQEVCAFMQGNPVADRGVLVVVIKVARF